LVSGEGDEDVSDMCSCATRAPFQLSDAAVELERVSGLRDLRLQLVEIGDLVSAGQRRLGRTERARMLDLPDPGGTNFERDFAIVRRQAGRAGQTLRDALQSETWSEIKRSVDTSGADFGASLDEFREMWREALVDADGPPVAAAEVAQIVDRVSTTMRDHGVGGLGAFLEEQFAEFDRVLVPDRDWGREPHSPLAWWEWVLLAGLIGASVFAVLACYWWSGCAWVRAALEATCAVIAAISGLEWLVPTCQALLRSVN
jgi:hypothetical protein